MRLWLRGLLTLVLAPLVWQLGAAYLAAEQGAGVDAVATAALAALPRLYLVYTLPALAGLVLLLVPADRLLARLGLDLLIVAVAPALAVLVPVVLSLVLADPQLGGAGVRWLAAAYGLVFGLTVREPQSRALHRGSASA